MGINLNVNGVPDQNYHHKKNESKPLKVNEEGLFNFDDHEEEDEQK